MNWWWYENGERVKDFLWGVTIIAVGVFLGSLAAIIVAFLKWA